MSIPSAEIRAALALLERHMDERGVTVLRLEKGHASWKAEASAPDSALSIATDRTLAEAGANAIVLARQGFSCAVCGRSKPDMIRISDNARVHLPCAPLRDQLTATVDALALRRVK